MLGVGGGRFLVRTSWFYLILRKSRIILTTIIKIIAANVYCCSLCTRNSCVLPSSSRWIFTIFCEWGNWGLKTTFQGRQSLNLGKLGWHEALSQCGDRLTWKSALGHNAHPCTIPGIGVLPKNGGAPKLVAMKLSSLSSLRTEPGHLLLRGEVLNFLQTHSFWVFHLKCIFVYDVRLEIQHSLPPNSQLVTPTSFST